MLRSTSIVKNVKNWDEDSVRDSEIDENQSQISESEDQTPN